ncbi:MAG: hypothetical protein LBJ11_09595 [Oscillospiraceae bacterium]|jgi:hypothetical protein|nr:hypothetical protein [Oscillospiraceae bacterium]
MNRILKNGGFAYDILDRQRIEHLTRGCPDEPQGSAIKFSAGISGTFSLEHSETHLPDDERRIALKADQVRHGRPETTIPAAIDSGQASVPVCGPIAMHLGDFRDGILFFEAGATCGILDSIRFENERFLGLDTWKTLQAVHIDVQIPQRNIVALEQLLPYDKNLETGAAMLNYHSSKAWWRGHVIGTLHRHSANQFSLEVILGWRS